VARSSGLGRFGTSAPGGTGRLSAFRGQRGIVGSMSRLCVTLMTVAAEA
jgi:hypothetical protein